MPMIDKEKHKIILVKILKEIYTTPSLRNVLGFKGGTAAFLFYDLPRISVDLDFDLLAGDKKDISLKLAKILPQFGDLQDKRDKRYTLFFLISPKKGERKIKIEVSKRKTAAAYKVRSYLGIPMLVMAEDDMTAGKLSAFLTRKKFAARDLFDLWFFLKNDWEINEKLVLEKTGLSFKKAVKKAIGKLKKIKKRQLLQGLGELLDEKQKQWVRENLVRELMFYLKLKIRGG